MRNMFRLSLFLVLATALMTCARPGAGPQNPGRCERPDCRDVNPATVR